ncbi:MAG: hypothetical protein COA96_02185 [SAR86 cluster bacterium]|uniref:DUF3325 domain-containing protein n=1 Tax=SAR86 cluster bacterium TaxID=2030880 RepID=A0A2A5B933_9GAMM|nr:MAG: hypothetical protein COA96_02185 [SAR86 cluster bacterium]
MIVAAVLLWFASLCAYLCSRQQTFLPKPIEKLTGWGLFTLLGFLAWLFMLGTFDPVTAIFIVVAFVMAAWIAIVLVRGHSQATLISFSSCGALISATIFGLGAF